MKKLFFTLASLMLTNYFATPQNTSQDTMYIFKNGSVTASFATINIDSITFYNPTGRNNSSIAGFVQKGPFISGTSISISELNTDLSQTGKTFTTQIWDNKGSFMIDKIKLATSFVSLRADGFYFNEILREPSSSQITLYALSDISDKSSINVNVLSHLEKPRVEYLISKGKSFSLAKSQAQLELLNIFNIKKPDIKSSELLDISMKGDDNAILLAVSLILQGYRTVGELTELLSSISMDIKEDGILSSSLWGSKLINHAVFLDTLSIRVNLEKRYLDLGVDAKIPNFAKYIKGFIDNTSFPITESLIEYPKSGSFGTNILDLEKTQYNDSYYSLRAKLARGTNLMIKITALGTGVWQYQLGTATNWSITIFDYSTKNQYFTAIESNKFCDLNMRFDSGQFLIEYFEMGSSKPTRTKTIKM